MQIRVSINTTTFARWRERVESALAVDRPGPMQDAVLGASAAYHGAMRLRFDEASAGSGVWDPLKVATVASHVKAGEPPPSILRKTGALEDSLQRGNPDHVLEVTETGVIEGTEDPKARFHQSGTTTAPAREILVPADQDTLDRMKARLVAGVSAIIHDQTGTALAATDSELEAIFGIEIE